MTNLEIAKKAISTLSVEELNSLTRSIKARRAVLEIDVASTIMPGDLVCFNARANHIVVGRVMKINAKSVIVLPNTGGTKWRVSPSLLKPVKESA